MKALRRGENIDLYLTIAAALSGSGGGEGGRRALGLPVLRKDWQS